MGRYAAKSKNYAALGETPALPGSQNKTCHWHFHSESEMGFTRYFREKGSQAFSWTWRHSAFLSALALKAILA